MYYNKLSKKEFEKLLVEKFPVIYRDMYGDPSKTCMAFGLDGISIGWHDIIYTMSEKLEVIASSESFFPEEYKDAPKLAFSQLKEKFGILRVYTNFSPKEIDPIIREAEDASSKICIDCGEPGTLIKKGWWATLCEAHATMSKYKEIMRNCEHAWKYDLKDKRSFLIEKVGWSEKNGGDESWANTEWRDMPEELQYVLVAQMKFLLEELDER